MNRLLSLLIIIILSACAIAPGMDLKKSSKNGIERVYLNDFGREYIEVENITKDLVVSLKNDLDLSIPNELLNYKPSEYLIGNGDVITITVWGPDELAIKSGVSSGPLFQRIVRKDGTIFYPYAGIINVAEKTREEVRQIIDNKLLESFTGAQVDLTITGFNSKKAILSGAFNSPGRIELNEVPITLSEALSIGGSPSDLADLSRFKLIRDGVSHEIDYEFFARTGTAVHEIYIKDEDVLHIPFNDEKKVYVVGEVVKQTSIDLRRKNISLSDALARSGGLSNQTADGSQVFIIRKASNVEEARIFQINLRSPAGFILAAEFEVLPQDIIYVGPANIAKWNRVISQFFPFTTFLNAVDNISQN